jgi:hypothetical protein
VSKYEEMRNAAAKEAIIEAMDVSESEIIEYRENHEFLFCMGYDQGHKDAMAENEAAFKVKDLEIKMLREQRTKLEKDYSEAVYFSVPKRENFVIKIRELHDAEITQALNALTKEQK